MAGKKQGERSGKARKKVKAGPGRPKDRERAEKAEQAKVIITMLPQMVVNSVIRCYQRGDEETAERDIKEFVYAIKRNDARRIAREIVDLLKEWPALEGGPGVKRIHPRGIADSLTPKKRKAFEEAWKRIALGFNEFEHMLKPSKISAFAHRHVARVGGPSGDPHSLAEARRRSEIDKIKHAAHELDEIWKDVRQDRDSELGEPPKSKKKTKKKK